MVGGAAASAFSGCASTHASSSALKYAFAATSSDGDSGAGSAMAAPGARTAATRAARVSIGAAQAKAAAALRGAARCERACRPWRGQRSQASPSIRIVVAALSSSAL